MKAEQVIKLIQSLEPIEIERLFVLVKGYEAEVRRRQALVSNGSSVIDEKFEAMVDQVFTENSELFQKLADLESRKRAKK